MEVASELLSKRAALFDATIQIPNEFVVDAAVVNVHLYQPSFQGFIDADVTPSVDPTTPVAKLQLTYSFPRDPPTICAKSLVPFLKNTDNILVGRRGTSDTLTEYNVAEVMKTPNSMLAVAPTVQDGLENECVKV